MTVRDNASQLIVDVFMKRLRCFLEYINQSAGVNIWAAVDGIVVRLRSWRMGYEKNGMTPGLYQFDKILANHYNLSNVYLKGGKWKYRR